MAPGQIGRHVGRLDADRLITQHAENGVATGFLSKLPLYFRNVTPAAAAPIEEVCPFEDGETLSLYYVTGGLISDAPVSTNATAYVVCFGGSLSNHLHILAYTSGTTTIGRMFIHTMRGGSSETWKEITAS